LIERFYAKELLGFLEVSLEFDKNLIIFTGPSGAGKSVLFDALLSLFGLKDAQALTAEISINKKLGLDEIGIVEDEPNIFKLSKQRSTRYFINNQQISKKALSKFSSNFIQYLGVKNLDEFESENLIDLLDQIIIKDNSNYKDELENFKQNYQKLKEKESLYKKLLDHSSNLSDLKSLAEFEINQIRSISPKVGEYEELMTQKKELSKKEKIEELLNECSRIFEYESKVSEALVLLDEQSEIFEEAMNDIRVKFEDARGRLLELEHLDIEKLLSRIEELGDLKRKYGSIEEALEHLAKREEELKGYENIDFDLQRVKKELEELNDLVQKDAKSLSKKRSIALKTLNQRANYYLDLLHLSDLEFRQKSVELHPLGIDKIEAFLKRTPISKVSSGELNRVRLALLATKSEYIKSEGKVLILDEIDANLSGKESMSVAKVLEQLSNEYQIFAISHQPQLSSKAQMHFLVTKEGDKSSVKLLNKDERIEELSRMISGEKITKEARDFAISLLDNSMGE